MPQCPDIKEMRCAAGQDESGKQPKYPAEVDFRTLPHEIGERKRDRIIRNSGYDIGNQMQPDQPRLPKQAKAVRREPALTENI